MMKKRDQASKKGWKRSLPALAFFAAFVLWTVLVSTVDVRPIGPCGSSVGFATMNGAFHRLTGVHLSLYVLTDWLGLVPIAAMLGFAFLGLCQWATRRSLFKVDRSLLVLGFIYLALAAAYLLFERISPNFRPLLIDGRLEESYPSSTTLLAVTVAVTSMLELRDRIRRPRLRFAVLILAGLFAVLLVFGRVLSGVHWLSDVIGALLLGLGLVSLYCRLR